METRLAQSLQLLLRSGSRGDVVPVPAQREVRISTDEHVVEFHCQVVLAAFDQRGHVFEEFCVEIGFREERVLGIRRVEQMLHTPDSVRWVLGPGWELLG